MKKKLLIAFIAIISVFCIAFSFTACGGDSNNEDSVGDNGQNETGIVEADGLKFEPNIEDGEVKYYTVSCIDSNLTHIVIPSNINSKSVSVIKSDGFKNCSKLESVTIPAGITSIGSAAFYGCEKLENLTIPVGVTLIEEDTFYGCTKLKSVNLPDGITAIGNGAFCNCKKLEAVSIPESVTKIDDEAFRWCESLKSLIVPNSVTVIGRMAFDSCKSLESITISDSIVSIGELAFSFCINLKNVTGPVKAYKALEASEKNALETVTITQTDKIDADTFLGCINLKSVTLPDGLKTIEDSAFSNCTSLKDITLPDSLETIGSNAFGLCTGLETFTIPNSVTTIGRNAFSNCENLKNLTIPNSVSTIGDYAFSYLRGLETLTCPMSVFPYLYNSKDNIKTLIITDGDEMEEVFAGYGLTYVRLPESLTKIGARAFNCCYNLMSINVPSNVTLIEDDAFNLCYKLVEIYNYSDLKIEKESNKYGGIGKYALDIYTSSDNESKIETTEEGYVYYNDYYKSLLGYAGDATDLILPEELNGKEYYIYPYAFMDCININKIVIPDNINYINEYEFYRCSSLTEIVVHQNFYEIGKNAFIGCSSLTTIYYKGTEEAWENIKIDSTNDYYLNEVTIYYYSETKPAEEGNYWHTVEGEIVKW